MRSCIIAKSSVIINNMSDEFKQDGPEAQRIGN